MSADDANEFESKPVIVPLGNAIKGIPKTQRAARAIKVIKRAVAKAMNEETTAIWIFDDVNEAIWARGRERPPNRIVVMAERIEEGHVEVRLPTEDELGDN
ncbi:MAG: 50S ribosomal protein L31e [Methanobacteriota archaeon]